MTLRTHSLANDMFALSVVAVLTACSAGDGGGGSFGSFGGPGGSPANGPADNPNAMDGGSGSTGTDEGAESDSSDGSTSDSGGAVGTTGETGMASAAMDESTDGGAGSSDGGSSGAMDDGMGNPGSQPANGMWAHCIEDDFTNCGAADTCIFLDNDGFCSVQGCTNPAIDCDPAPAGTAVTPICADAVSPAVCALDCSTAACPAGMVCTAVSINMGADVNICV